MHPQIRSSKPRLVQPRKPIRTMPTPTMMGRVVWFCIPGHPMWLPLFLQIMATCSAQMAWPTTSPASLWSMWPSSGRTYMIVAVSSRPNPTRTPSSPPRKALFTMSSTAGLPYQVSAFDAEGAIKDEWTLIPFPWQGWSPAPSTCSGNILPSAIPASHDGLLGIPEIPDLSRSAGKWIQGSAYYPTRSDTLPLLSEYLAADRSGPLAPPSCQPAQLNRPGLPGLLSDAKLVIPSRLSCKVP